MRAGPKGSIRAEPLSWKGWPRDRAKRRLRFIREFLVVPKGHGAGRPVRLRDFQKDIIGGAFAEGVRTALVSVPRANGKTALAAMLAVAELFCGDESAEVLVVASDQRQANITLRMARRMIELNPVLAERAHVYQDRLVVPERDSILLPLPADPGALHGHDPSLLIVDELHVVDERVWEAVSSVSGKRPESLTMAISTPATSQDSIMWRLVEHGRAGDDPAFWFKEFAAPHGCAIDDREAWRIANPALSCKDPFLAEDGLASARRTLREPVFRQLRLGQWVAGVDSWMPHGAWDKIADPARTVRAGERVVLAFDGSASGDSTALIGCTIGQDPHLFVVGLWENPGDPRWRVPRAEVARTIATAFDRYDVLELAADPWGWRSELESWAEQFGERHVIEWNTANARQMAPATDRMFQAVVEDRLTHDGNTDLAKHIAHCKAERTSLGDLVKKDKKNSPRKIDAAVAAIVALDRAAWHSMNTRKRRAAAFR